VNLFNDLLTVVGKVSPLLGHSLSSPVGGILLTILANSVKADPRDLKDIIEKIKADPESDMKIKDMEAMVSDLQSARSREVAFVNATKQRDWMMPLLALVCALGFIFMAWIVALMDAGTDDKYFMYAVVIGMGVQFAQVYNYYFGRYNSELLTTLSAPLVKIYNVLFKKP